MCLVSQVLSAAGLGASTSEAPSMQDSVDPEPTPAAEHCLAGTLIVATVTATNHWEQELASKVGAKHFFRHVNVHWH